MKNYFLILPVLIIVLTLVSTGCQKEEGTVTLGAETQKPVNDNSKVYIDNHTPCWHNADQVYINNAAYPVLAASGSSARIENVVSSSTYRAIFPAGIVAEESNIGNNASFPITLPSTQTYQVLDGVQRVDVPMGAYLTSGSTLQFHNLCSVVRVTVSNSLTTALSLQSIVLNAENAYLSGDGTATVSGSSSDRITISHNSSHSVTLVFPSNNPVTVGALRSADFDIIVPAFTTDNVTITINTTDGYYFSLPKHKALAQNTITTVTLNVTELSEYAELVDGPTFRNAIPNTATSIVFEYNSCVSSGTLLSTTNSTVPIYGNLDGTIWRVSTCDSKINANPNCASMFNLGYEDRHRLTSIEFGEDFNTSNVTDMRNMFGYCCRLTNLNLSSFNTSNVIYMSSMFSYCRSLENLDLSSFNTSNVTDMGYMFYYCRSLRNLNLSSFNTSNVTNMSYMFCFGDGGCGLISLDVSNFNTTNVTDMRCMFSSCSSLTSINVSNFNTTNVTDMGWMFSNCSSLTSIDVSHFNTTNVEDMSYMFNTCRGLTNLDVSTFNTSNITNMEGMFCQCDGLTSLDLSNFNTSNVMNMSIMFWNCSRLTNLDLSNFIMNNGIYKSGMCHYVSVISGNCTITCPETVQTELISGTDLPTSGVTFTWVRP